MFRYVLPAVLLAFFVNFAEAGTGYEVTSTKDGKTITYNVNFGGGMMFEQYTAFDPASKKFVYLTWKRGEKKPEPACKIWNHTTGETIELYKFPKAEHPLPVIPSMRAMKVCPITGDKNFKAGAVVAYD